MGQRDYEAKAKEHLAAILSEIRSFLPQMLPGILFPFTNSINFVA